ncbi:MAG: NAD(P)H-hydrate epimerase, partial [Planctomycetota bacterium]
SPAPGEAWAAIAEPSPLGAAALAALRLAHNLGAEAQVYLAGESIDACAEFAVMLEVAGCMNLPVRLWNEEARTSLSEETRLLWAASPRLPEETRGIRLPLAEVESADAWNAKAAGSRPETFLHRATAGTPVLSAAAVRALDAAATREYGLPGLCLMENAGIGAAAVARDMLARRPEAGVLVLAGRGNNGGDAFVAARGLCEGGYSVRVALLAEPEALRGDARENYEILAAGGLACACVAKDMERLEALLREAPLVVDGLLGTGLAGEVKGPVREAIERVNASGAEVLALDLPSGLDADTGAVLGAAVCAERTVTFAALKPGLLQGEGPRLAGEVTVADIGAPAELLRGGRG